MKKYILLCLLAGSILLASIQTYAAACSAVYPIGSEKWDDCILPCLLLPSGFDIACITVVM
ncbi:hypothetical protein Xekj_04216 [Xenorhabdus sp. KJ12.1]|nr:hypothetical protein Xekj_04216 [Xenorhabdus sp. KJ12.1]